MDEETQYKNQKAREESQNLSKDINVLRAEQLILRSQKDILETERNDIVIEAKTAKVELDNLVEKRKELSDEISHLLDDLPKRKSQIEADVENYYKDKKEVAEAAFEQSLMKMREELLKSQEEYEAEYSQAMADAAAALALYFKENKEEIEAFESELNDFKKKVESAVEASKRAEAMKTEKDFYRLQIPKEDLEEINALREIVPRLRDPEALNKVIWKVYYEKPTNDLIGRVIGAGTHTGIYKITNIENDKCYVGQAVNLAERWKQHIKRGLGAETATKNKLYPAMKSTGVENFTFEVIEKCDKNQLDKQEDYWQDYFHAKDYGYSIK